MKQAEKLDALLLQLYHHKYDGRWYSINQLFADKGITITNDVELLVTATRLVSDGLINARTTDNDISAMITGDGITFCETSSFSVPGVSLSNLSFENINDKIVILRSYILLSDIDENLKDDLKQGLSELSIIVTAGKKPLFCLAQLLSVTIPYPIIHKELLQLRELIVSS